MKDKQQELEALRQIVAVSARAGAEFHIDKVHTRQDGTPEYRMFIDFNETRLNIWTDDTEIIAKLSETVAVANGMILRRYSADGKADLKKVLSRYLPEESAEKLATVLDKDTLILIGGTQQNPTGKSMFCKAMNELGYNAKEAWEYDAKKDGNAVIVTIRLDRVLPYYIFKDIPTAALVEELSRRTGVKKYPCDLYQHNYRAQIYRAYTEGDFRQPEQMPPHYDVLVIEREKGDSKDADK